MLIVFGTVMAMVNGTVLPLMCIVFGDMTDSFVTSETTNINFSNPSKFLFAGIDIQN